MAVARSMTCLTQVEGSVFQLELARFDLAVVEDVIDHGQQGLAGVENAAETARDLASAAVAQAHLGQSQDGVQGGADFVAHIGQELAARGGQPAGLGQSRFPRRFQAPALGDVGGHADDGRLALVVEGAALHFDLEAAAVPAQGREGVLGDALPLFDTRLDAFEDLLAVFGSDQVHDGDLANHCVGIVVAEQGGKGGIDVGEAALAEDVDTHQGLLDQAAEFFLGLGKFGGALGDHAFQLFLLRFQALSGQDPLRDVGGLDGDPDDASAPIQHRLHDEVLEAYFAAAQGRGDFEAACLTGDGRLHRFPDTVPHGGVVVVPGAFPEGTADQIIHAGTRRAQGRVVDDDDAARRVEEPQIEERRVEHGAGLQLALAQGHFGLHPLGHVVQAGNHALDAGGGAEGSVVRLIELLFAGQVTAAGDVTHRLARQGAPQVGFHFVEQGGRQNLGQGPAVDVRRGHAELGGVGRVGDAVTEAGVDEGQQIHRGVEDFAEAAQVEFGCDALAHVGDDDDDVGLAPDDHGAEADFDVEFPAVPAQGLEVAPLAHDAGRAVGGKAFPQTAVGAAHRGRDEGFHRLVQEFPCGVAEHALGFRVEAHDAPVARHHQNALGHPVQNEVGTGLAVPQGILDRLQVADVLDRAPQVRRASVAFPGEFAAYVHPADCPVGGAADGAGALPGRTILQSGREFGRRSRTLAGGAQIVPGGKGARIGVVDAQDFFQDRRGAPVVGSDVVVVGTHQGDALGFLQVVAGGQQIPGLLRHLAFQVQHVALLAGQALLCAATGAAQSLGRQPGRDPEQQKPHDAQRHVAARIRARGGVRRGGHDAPVGPRDRHGGARDGHDGAARRHAFAQVEGTLRREQGPCRIGAVGQVEAIALGLEPLQGRGEHTLRDGDPQGAGPGGEGDGDEQLVARLLSGEAEEGAALACGDESAAAVAVVAVQRQAGVVQGAGVGVQEFQGEYFRHAPLQVGGQAGEAAGRGRKFRVETGGDRLAPDFQALLVQGMDQAVGRPAGGIAHRL